MPNWDLTWLSFDLISIRMSSVSLLRVAQGLRVELSSEAVSFVPMPLGAGSEEVCFAKTSLPVLTTIYGRPAAC